MHHETNNDTESATGLLQVRGFYFMSDMNMKFISDVVHVSVAILS